MIFPAPSGARVAGPAETAATAWRWPGTCRATSPSATAKTRAAQRWSSPHTGGRHSSRPSPTARRDSHRVDGAAPETTVRGRSIDLCTPHHAVDGSSTVRSARADLRETTGAHRSQRHHGAAPCRCARRRSGCTAEETPTAAGVASGGRPAHRPMCRPGRSATRPDGPGSGAPHAGVVLAAMPSASPVEPATPRPTAVRIEGGAHHPCRRCRMPADLRPGGQGSRERLGNQVFCQRIYRSRKQFDVRRSSATPERDQGMILSMGWTVCGWAHARPGCEMERTVTSHLSGRNNHQ